MKPSTAVYHEVIVFNVYGMASLTLSTFFINMHITVLEDHIVHFRSCTVYQYKEY